MLKWWKKKLEKIKISIDKWLKNRITYKINEENNKHDSKSAKEFDDRVINILDKVFGDELMKQDSNLYKRKKAEYQNDSNMRKVVIETETVNQTTILQIDDQSTEIATIETINDVTIKDIKKVGKTNRIENETHETNFDKETRRTEEKNN